MTILQGNKERVDLNSAKTHDPHFTRPLIESRRTNGKAGIRTDATDENSNEAKKRLQKNDQIRQ